MRMSVGSKLIAVALVALLIGACSGEPDIEAQVANTDESQTRQYDAEEIKAAMRAHIARRTEFGSPGVFEITDPRTSQTLQLVFEKIHDPVRSLGNNRYFACTNFHLLGAPERTFDLDFWLMPHEGQLIVYEENVHKLPALEAGEWVQQPRYTFVDGQISLLR